MAGDGSGGRAKLLILGGTAEAVALAGACASRPGLAVISSLAGRTQHPNLPPGDVRIGGFGGAAGLARFLLERGIDRVIDATHPFAAQISAHAEHACREAGVPRVRLLRPPWVAVAGDRWTEVASIAEAAQRLPEARASRLPDPREPRARCVCAARYLVPGANDRDTRCPAASPGSVAYRARAFRRRGRALPAADACDRGAGDQGERRWGHLRQAGRGAAGWAARAHGAPAATAARPGRGLGCSRARLARRLYLGAPPAGRRTWW